MIAYLSGNLIELDFTRIIIDVNGVGYEVFIPMSTYDKLPRLNNNVSLFIHTAVKEDSITLFGFSAMEEKTLFLLLISISGIGPKTTLNILSAMPASLFCEYISSGDVKAISRINGLGKRTSERIVLELKEKVDKISISVQPTRLNDNDVNTGIEVSRAAEDAIAALETLGFKGNTVRKAVYKLLKNIPKEEQSAENIIKNALHALNT